MQNKEDSFFPFMQACNEYLRTVQTQESDIKDPGKVNTMAYSATTSDLGMFYEKQYRKKGKPSLW